MKNIKDELQHIIFGHGPAGEASQLKKTQRFLRSNAETSFTIKKQQQLKSEEAVALLTFAGQENIIYCRKFLRAILLVKVPSKKFIG